MYMAVSYASRLRSAAVFRRACGPGVIAAHADLRTRGQVLYFNIWAIGPTLMVRGGAGMLKYKT